jgi:uncharacterized membrane protein
MSTELKRESALRGVWSKIFFAALSILLSHATREFWGDDFVSAAFQWFFANYGLYAGLAALIFFVAVVVDRVNKGERIKGDLALFISVSSLIVSILGLLPDSIRAQLLQTIVQSHG